MFCGGSKSAKGGSKSASGYGPEGSKYAVTLAIPVRRSNQMSYEATDIGIWSFVVGSNEPMRSE